ncbi:hypothetical protein CNR22_10320 [Sphingobacteriaceae bacterium]|nr:hypothetical protein CNR22_10320 [Sphingobacteriaceae bacterium]
MKRKITLLLLAAGSLFKMNSQVVLSENFTATWTPATFNWGVQNNSSAAGSLSWFQGNGTNVFPAYNGGVNDYYAANFNSQATTQGGISNWLITPTVTIYNGAVIEFATRTPNTATVFPDGLQLRMSTAGVSSVIPTGSASVGTFTNLLLDINPLLSTSTASAVSNGSVNGYPNAWTVYSVQISGVTGTVTGRFAFRYVVDDGGPNGTNSSYVGIDAVKYTLPCGPTVQNYTTCAGASTTIQAMGLPVTTYSWSTGATTSSIVVSPSTTTTYSLYPSANATSCGTVITAVITVSTNLQVGVSASDNTVCAGETVTLTASGSATSYTWIAGSTPIGTGAVITVTPGANTTYSVAGQTGFCFGGTGISITALPNPTVTIATANSVVCVNGPSTTATFSAGGASAYLWVVGASTATNVNINLIISAQTATTPAAYTQTVGLLGQSANGCISEAIYTLTINKTPSLSVASNTVKACTNSTVTLTATATNSTAISGYTWTSGSVTGTTNPLALAVGTVVGSKTISIVVSSANGCTNTATFSQSVAVCSTTTTTNTVGVGSYSPSEELSIFPNPFANELRISALDGKVIVYNTLGQAVITSVVRSSETINTSELPKGAYFVKAFNENGEVVKTVKLVKN